MNSGRSHDVISETALRAFRKRYPNLASTGGLDAGPPVRVKRLDRADSYLLVPIGDDVGLRGIVQFDARGANVESSASISDRSSSFLMAEKEALAASRRALPNRTGWRKPFLAWRPCRESFDSMRPLWVVPHRDGQVYVTQGGKVSETLTGGRGV